MFQLTINGKDYRIDSIKEIERLLSENQNLNFAEIWLSHHTDEKWQDRENSAICVLVNGDLSFVVFEKEAGNYFHSVNPLYDNTKDEIDFMLFNGQRDFYPKSFCVETLQAVKAVLHFYETGQKADWIRWEKD